MIQPELRNNRFELRSRDNKGVQLFPARHPAAVTTALLPLASALFLALFPATDLRAQGAPACEEAAEIAVLPSPVAPWKGAPLRVMLAAEKPLSGTFSLVAPDGSVATKSAERHGGPPYFWFAEVPSPAAGKWRVMLTGDRTTSGCAIAREITVRADRPPPPQEMAGMVWPLRNTWNRATENLYSAWIEKLFDAPLEEELSWRALHEVLRDQSRNFLFNHLGLGEDSMKMVLRPDCADLPYFLRAYFAFKMGLPFGYSICSRGGGGKAPRCPQWFSIQNRQPATSAAAPPPTQAAVQSTPAPKRSSGFLASLLNKSDEEPQSEPVAAVAPSAPPPAPKRLGLAASFGRYSQAVGNGVHSGSGRTALNDNSTDYYPVPLSEQTLRPGTVYADPYGHILVLVRRVAQTADAAGVIMAVDGQPDGTVARKRFWRGNFLFAQDPALGGPGFKRFRPIVLTKAGALHRLTNDEIARNPDYADFSLDQAKLGMEQFYDRMDDVMSPEPLDPLRAMKEAITSLDEQVKVRVTSVENGRKFQGSGREANMPDGPAIFETTGPWEDFSTPSRDLRLLIAIDVVRGFPDRVERRPERYAMPRNKSIADVKAELQRVLASELTTRKFSYPRSDGSQWTLTLKDVFDRMSVLEMAYNPNDCVELRWGASERSDEAATCRKHAPSAQRAKMTKYRAWFHERRRPPRA
jgi:hypothetical protein